VAKVLFRRFVQFLIEPSLQQRVCSGFSPDSLFISIPWIRNRDTKTGAKVQNDYELARIKKLF
jgi:hypothetical protein